MALPPCRREAPRPTPVVATVVLALASFACGGRSGLDDLEPPPPARDASDAPDADGGRADADTTLPPLVPRRIPFSIRPGQLLDVAARDNGDFLILWNVGALDTPEGEGSEVRGQLFDSNAEPLDDSFLVYASNEFGLTGVASFLEDGSFVVGFPVATGTRTAFRYGVRVRRYDAEGVPVPGAETLLNDEWRPTVTGLEGGGFVLGTRSWVGDSIPGTLLVRDGDMSGDFAGAPRRMDEGCGRTVATPGGGYTIVCSEPDPVAHRFDSDGAALGSPLSIATYEDSGVDAFAYLPDGGFVVGSGGFVRPFDSDASPTDVWLDVRGPGEESVEPRAFQLARSGCGGRRCRFTSLFMNGDLEDERPISRDHDAAGRPIFEGGEPLLAPAASFDGPRAYYGESDVAGGRYGQAVMAWGAMDRTPEGGLALSVEGLLVVRE